jgi:hypothetical protein
MENIDSSIATVASLISPVNNHVSSDIPSDSGSVSVSVSVSNSDSNNNKINMVPRVPVTYAYTDNSDDQISFDFSYDAENNKINIIGNNNHQVNDIDTATGIPTVSDTSAVIDTAANTDASATSTVTNRIQVKVAEKKINDKFLENQRKFLLHMEKQLGRNNKNVTDTSVQKVEKKTKVKKIMVGGKIRYVHIKEESPSKETIDINTNADTNANADTLTPTPTNTDTPTTSTTTDTTTNTDTDTDTDVTTNTDTNTDTNTNTNTNTNTDANTISVTKSQTVVITENSNRDSKIGIYSKCGGPYRNRCNNNVGKNKSSDGVMSSSVSSTPVSAIGDENKNNFEQIRLSYGKKKVPPRLAKQMEAEIKKKLISCAKTLDDYKKVNLIKDLDLDPNLDIMKMSLDQLKKLKTDQGRAKPEVKQKSQIQLIQSDPNMSAYDKFLAIRNLQKKKLKI